MAPASSKLSLAAQFDDFCRLAVRKSSIEREFLEFVKNQEECRKRWHTAELENVQLRKELEALKGSHVELQRKLAYTREVLDKEVQRRERSEEEKVAKSKQLELIREFIMNDPELRDETMEKLPFLRPSNANEARLNTIDESVGSVLSVSHEGLDESDEDNGGRPRRSTRSRGERSSGKAQPEDGVNTRKRRSPGMQEGGGEVEAKRANVIATTTVTLVDGKEYVTTSRFFAQPASTVPTAPPMPSPAPPAATVPAAVTRAGTPITTPVRQPPRSGPESAPRRTNSASKLQSRVHDFCLKTVIKPETCGPCGKRIKFYRNALKCTRCRSTSHPECSDQVPLPCIQVSQTPTQGGSHGYQNTVIADHVPSESPMVPAIVVHCMQEVERRGLSEVGLYRVSGSEREVREIRERFLRNKGIPNLANADIHAVCGVLKDFLRSLRETLITKSLWKNFVKAADDPVNHEWATWQAVTQLPQPNRDTLAALVLHLQTVSERPEVKMPVSNLARVFGPTVVGFSVSDIDSVSDVHQETEKQAKVMESILNIPAEFWKTYMDVESDDDIRTPEVKPGPGSTILGPLHGSLGKKSGRTPQRFTPASRTKISLSVGAANSRNLQKGHSIGTRRNFFTSPALK